MVIVVTETWTIQMRLLLTLHEHMSNEGSAIHNVLHSTAMQTEGEHP